MTAEQLADAKAKYHLLATGQLPRVILDGNDGSRLEYQGVNADKLLAYIRTADPTYLVPTDGRQTVSRPFGFTF